MVQTMVQPEISDLLFKNLIGLIEVREIGHESAKSRFFKGLEQFKAYTPPTDKNVYVGMFSRLKPKGVKANCFHTNVLWADYDHTTLEEAKSKISGAGLPIPSILVNSGHGVHSYWLLDKPAKDGIEEVLKAIATKTGADIKAAEKARVMRMPGTLNVKEEIPKKCEIVEQNDNRYSLETFMRLLNVGQREKVEIEELQTSKMACIRFISKGVGKGQRNFALGKITAYMKQQGFSRKKAFEIAKQWNQNNNPVKPDYELQDQFNRFWDSDYKYLGCKFSNPDLERVNRQLCPIGECEYHAMQSAQVVNADSTVAVDNELFKDTVYPKIKGLEIACYSLITREKELSKEQLSKYVNRHIRNDNFIQAIRSLKAKGFIEIQQGTSQNGVPDKVLLKSKSNYGRGYTLVPTLLTKLYTKKGISENAYKLMVLLKHYSFGKSIVYPTIETMAAKLGISERWVTKLLKWLEEEEGLIERNYKQLDNGKTKLTIKLKY